MSVFGLLHFKLHRHRKHRNLWRKIYSLRSGVFIMVILTWSLSERKSPVDARQVKVDFLSHNFIYLLLVKKELFIPRLLFTVE